MINVISDNDIKLTKPCSKHWEGTNYLDCPHCGNTEEIPSIFGEEILSFIKKYDALYELSNGSLVRKVIK